MTEPTHFDTGAREWDQRPTSLQLAAVPPRLLAQVPSPPPTACWTLAQAPVCWRPPSPRTWHRSPRWTAPAPCCRCCGKGFANITTLQQDIFDGLPERYDAIVSCMAMHHVPDTRALLQAFADALQPGGRIALVDLYAEGRQLPRRQRGQGACTTWALHPMHCRRWPSRRGCRALHSPKCCACTAPNGREYPLF